MGMVITNNLRPPAARFAVGIDQRNRVDLETGCRFGVHIRSGPDAFDRRPFTQQETAGLRRRSPGRFGMKRVEEMGGNFHHLCVWHQGWHRICKS